MNKKYITSKQLGNKGEAIVETLLSENAIVHSIDGSKDVGLDFLCEWVSGENPTRLLFGVQVKATRRLKKIDEGQSRLNSLQQFQINPPSINENTFEYWRGFDFPIFLFLVHFHDKEFDCYYKRYSPILHGASKVGEEYFYKVNFGNQFIALNKRPAPDGRSGGFCRDLFFDHLRCQYNKGILSSIDPKDLGLEGYTKNAIYNDILKHYKKQIAETMAKYKKWGF